MNRLSILKSELEFLEKQLPELQSHVDLAHLAAEFKRRIESLRQQIQSLEEQK